MSLTKVTYPMIQNGVVFGQKNFGVYCCDLTGPSGTTDPYSEAEKIAKLGCTFVVYYSGAKGNATYIASDKVSLDALDQAGLSVWFCPFGSDNKGTNVAVYAANYVDVPNIVGWYVLDEPAGEATIAEQDAVITAIKAVKDLPCITAENAFDNVDFNSPVSALYDYILPDVYAAPGQAFPETDFEIATQVIPYLASQKTMNRIFPALGAYVEAPGTIQTIETYLNVWRNQLDFYPNKNCVFFIWNNGPVPQFPASSITTISQSDVLYASVKGLIRGYVGANTKFAYVSLISTVQANVGYTEADLRNGLISTFNNPKTTGTVRSYDGAVANLGMYLNNGQIAVIDFGKEVSSVRVQAKYFNQFGAQPLGFTFYTPDDLTFATGTTVDTITPTAGDSTIVELADLKSRYLIIKSTTDAAADGFVFMRSIYIVGS